jgi:nitroimidazol reductase NimA-like FMN-containing flavoprotein (pyridoxamine 5'-phosphate oxidase superfamily)
MAVTPVTVLSEDESWERLSRVALGRLVTNFAGEPEIFPVNYVVQDRTVLFRTAEGTKLYSAVSNRTVVFEADDYNPTEGWSVIVRGRARRLQTDAEIQKAEHAQLASWIATPKDCYVRVTASDITGRHFRFGPGPHASNA